MKRFAFLAALFAPVAAICQKPGQKKFYITGHSPCTPPLVAYGTSRVDALLNCCESGAVTVWTEEEWADVEKKGIPASIKKFCDATKDWKPCPKGKACIAGKDGWKVVGEEPKR